MREARRGVGALAFYVGFFALLFVPFALRGELPGNCDTWLGIALANGYGRSILALFGGPEPGSAMYPFGPVFAYGESSPLGAAVFLLFRGVGLGDLGAWLGLVVGGYAATAWGVHLLARALGCGFAGALFAGLAFAGSNFALANVDDVIVVVYVLPALALRALLLQSARPDSRRLLVGGLLGGLQAYLSIYVFVYQSLAVAALAPFVRLPWRDWGRFAAPYVALAAPIFLFYALVYARLDVVTELAGKAQSLTEYRSLDASDLLGTLPHNRIYAGDPLPEGIPFWLELRKRAFLGFAVLVLAGLGLRGARPGRAFASLLVALGLLVSWGAPLRLGEITLQAPLYWLYASFDWASFVRLPFRGYFLTSLGLSLLAARGVDALVGALGARRRAAAALCAALLAFHVVENLPRTLPRFAAEPFLEVPPAYRSRVPGPAPRVVLDLPSRGFGIELFQHADQPLFAYNREVIYMNWQTQHLHHILGGLHGYLTRERREVYEAIHAVPAAQALERLEALGLEFIVFHRTFVLEGEGALEEALEASPRLRRIHRDARVAIYALGGKTP